MMARSALAYAAFSCVAMVVASIPKGAHLRPLLKGLIFNVLAYFAGTDLGIQLVAMPVGGGGAPMTDFGPAVKLKMPKIGAPNSSASIHSRLGGGLHVNPSGEAYTQQQTASQRRGH